MAWAWRARVTGPAAGPAPSLSSALAAELRGGGPEREGVAAPMGKAAASSSSCSAGTRGLVSFLSAVPCLACKQQPPPPPSASQVLVAMSLAGSVLEGLSPAPSASGTSAGASPSSAGGPGSDTYKGWLFKWTNYLKGYQRRWFVLSNGLLSYYRYRGNAWLSVCAGGGGMRAYYKQRGNTHPS